MATRKIRKAYTVAVQGTIFAIPLVISTSVSFTNGVATVDLTSFIPSGYSLVAGCFAEAKDTGSITVTGAQVSPTNKTMTIKTSNQSYTGSTDFNLLIFMY